jgi:membrane-bound lytic murein transglycosylase F
MNECIYTDEYDELFQSLAKVMDWRLYKAQGIVESGLDPKKIGEPLAIGIMQVLLSVGEDMGYKRYELFEPEKNIEAAVRYMAWLHSRWENDIPNHDERWYFVLASYKAGITSVRAAFEKAKRKGLECTDWGVVSSVFLRKFIGRKKALRVIGYIAKIKRVYDELFKMSNCWDCYYSSGYFHGIDGYCTYYCEKIDNDCLLPDAEKFPTWCKVDKLGKIKNRRFYVPLIRLLG